MLRFLTSLILLLTVTLVAGPLQAVGFAATDVPTVIIPAGQQNDQFDEDFDDDFDDDFADEGSFDEILIADPLEGFNRGMFWVNDKLYFYLAKPVAKGYRFIVPRPVRVSVGNFFSNLLTPMRAANALLQLKFTDFGTEIYRFVVNSTIGIAGLFDPATSLAGVEKVEEDFGQTLGYYGAGHGFYLVLPVLGPSSLRDTTGGLVDTVLDPFWYADLTTMEHLGAKVFKVTNGLSLDKDTYESIVRDSLDPYLFVRAAYAQRRAAQVGKVDYSILTIDGSFLNENNLNPFKWLGM
ncbi:MAG: VacJ family lipoprotein [Desulfuromonadales bacterium]|nr:VacJ family lipoprotein [Chloroflexota bacterium]MCK4621573.1 VacJ family lipoprotein [Desulfuromonadales bacterium]